MITYADLPLPADEKAPVTALVLVTVGPNGKIVSTRVRVSSGSASIEVRAEDRQLRAGYGHYYFSSGVQPTLATAKRLDRGED